MAGRFDARGDRVRVIMAGPLPPAIGGMATVIEDMSRSSLASQVDLHLFDTKKTTPEGRSLLQAIGARFSLWRAWWRQVSSKNTLAHIHTCSGLSYFLDVCLLLLARLGGSPVVLHIHGARFDRFLDGLPSPLRLLAQFGARNASAVVVLSEEWRERMASRLPGARLTVIHNAVAEPPEVIADTKKGHTVLFLGNLCARKGVWDLLRAMVELNGQVRLVFVGGEEEPGIGPKLQQEIQRLGLDEHVMLAGPAFGAEKYRWLAEADCFALPSHAEGLPISLLEAMAARLPVVVTPVGGIPSVIEDEVNGLMVPVGDGTALARALRRLIEDAELRARLGEAAHTLCMARFGMQRAVDDYLRLYRRLLPNPS